MKLRVFVDHRSVSRKTKLDFDGRRLALNLDHLALDLHLLPFIFVTILSGIRRIGLFDVEVLLIDSDDCEPKTDSLVVTRCHSGQRWLSGADHVPARPDQVNKVSERRQADVSMRIVGKNGLARFGEPTAHHPVIRAFA